jgi:hypothetical protein
VQAQRAGWPSLEADQQDLLAAIGIGEDQVMRLVDFGQRCCSPHFVRL